MNFYVIYFAAIALICLIAFCLYGIDKRRARKNAWRIKESVLLGFAFFGGAVGALFGMKCFRHKTKHWYFWAVAMLGLVWQIGAPVAYFLLTK